MHHALLVPDLPPLAQQGEQICREHGIAIPATRPRKLENTAFYTKVATRTVRTVTSPLDKLGLFKMGEISPDG
jgi:hypothetical protein